MLSASLELGYLSSGIMLEAANTLCKEKFVPCVTRVRIARLMQATRSRLLSYNTSIFLAGLSYLMIDMENSA